MPNARTLTTDNSFAVDELTLQDAVSTVPIENFIGGTILKVLMDIELRPAFVFAGGPLSGYLVDHLGIFTDQGITPEQTIWSPNVPSGDFMIRESFVNHWYLNNANNPSWYFEHHKHIETNVKRKIRENDSLFISWFHFEDGVVMTNSQLGWTGRVLIALP